MERKISGPPVLEGSVNKGGVNGPPDMPPPAPPRGQGGSHQINSDTMIKQAKDSVLAMNRANLEAAPIFCELCGELLTGLLSQGFNRSESLEIITAAVRK